MDRLLACLLLLIPAVAAGAELQPVAPVERVTVYPSGATVERRAELDLPAGDHRLTFRPLPLDVDPARVTVISDALEVRDLEWRKIHLSELARDREQALQEELEALQDRQRAVTDRRERLQMQIDFIRQLADRPQGGDAGGYHRLPPEQWPPAWQTLTEGVAEAQAGIREADDRRQAIRADIERVRAELDEIRSGERAVRSLTVGVRTSAEGPVSLTLRYPVDRAGWSPIYRARLDTTRPGLVFETRANLHQETGEDWQDVEVVLSTQRPRARPEPPELQPWVLRLREPAALRKGGIAPQAEMARRSDAMAPARAETSAFFARYRLDGRLDLASGTRDRQVGIARRHIDPELELRTVPRRDPRALLRARFELPGEMPWLAGPVELFRDGTRVGRTRIGLTHPGDRLALGFGEDDRVSVAFHPRPDKRGTKGLIRERKTVRRLYRFEIANAHSRPVDITLLDQLPVAGDEAIEVELTGDSRQPDRRNVDDKEGVLAWDLTLPAGETETLDFGFEVSYPKDREIHGI